MKNYRLHALASAFAAYLMDQAGESIKGIYLFGSVARRESTKESDIDIFVDSIKNHNIIRKTAEAFESTTLAKIFRATGIKNTIRALVGNINNEEFSDVRLSLEADGIVLYGKNIPAEKKGRQPFLLIWFGTPRQQRKKVAFLREIYGRKEKDKTYVGMLQKLGGFKVSPNTILIPIRNKATLLNELNKAKVRYTVKNVWF